VNSCPFASSVSVHSQLSPPPCHNSRSTRCHAGATEEELQTLLHVAICSTITSSINISMDAGPEAEDSSTPPDGFREEEVDFRGENEEASSVPSELPLASPSDGNGAARVPRPRMALSGEACGICLCEFASGEELHSLHADQHFFHQACLFEWLRIRACCPSCRLPLRGREGGGGADAAEVAATAGAAAGADGGAAGPEAAAAGETAAVDSVSEQIEEAPSPAGAMQQG
jgi:hypothetical protein